MKKLLLSIPVTLLFLNFLYQNDGPNMWTQSLAGSGAIWGIAINPSNQQIIYAASNTSGIWKTTNGGLNWVQSNGSITNLTMQCVAISASNPNVLYCGTSATGFGNGMYKSTDAAVTWTQVNTGITQTPLAVQWIAVSPADPNTALIAIWDGGTANATDGVYKTTNGGTSWTASNTGMTTNKNVLCVEYNPLNANVVYCGTSFMVPNPPGTGPSYIYKSFNGGNSWSTFSTGLPSTATDLNPLRALSISTSDTSVVLAALFHNNALGGAYVSTNGGTSWVRRSNGIPTTLNLLLRACLIRGGTSSQFFVGLDQTTPATVGVYRTTDQGNTWTSFNSGVMLGTYPVRALIFRTTADSTVFAGVAGTTGQGVYEYSFGPLGLPDPNEVPTSYNLYQNYPNPFNPVTKIVYQIPKASFVKLSVYDAEGKLVKVLYEGMQTQLTNTIEFSAADLSSGVYFYEMNAGDFRGVKKMILVK
jgi:hypothetical protein